MTYTQEQLMSHLESEANQREGCGDGFYVDLEIVRRETSGYKLVPNDAVVLTKEQAANICTMLGKDDYAAAISESKE